jgi:hypothetical protein
MFAFSREGIGFKTETGREASPRFVLLSIQILSPARIFPRRASFASSERRANRRRARSPFALHLSPLKGRHQTHAKLKSILTFAFSAPLW